MQVDFSVIEDVESFVSIPEGTYSSSISEVRTTVTRDGSPRWSLRLVVFDGEYAGRTAAWDSLIWSERGLPRVKTVLEKLGFDVSGPVEVAPEDLVGRRIVAQYITEEREDADTGRQITRLRVPYMGYEALSDADTPF